MNKKNIDRRLAIFIMAIMILTVLSGCTGGEEGTTTTTPAPTVPPNFVTYENSTYGIRIMHPQEWEIMENYMGTVVLFKASLEDASDMFQENLNVVVGDLPEPMKLDEFTDANIDQIKSIFAAEVVDSSSTTLANNPARKVIYNLKQGQYDLKLMQIYMLKGNKAYVITYTAEEDKYSDLLGTIQAMINTFEII
jgi:serine/threonine-protein kinase